MLKNWVKLLPFFIVEIIAKKGCERFLITEGIVGKPESIRTVVCPFHGVYIETNYNQRIIDEKIDELHR